MAPQSTICNILGRILYVFELLWRNVSKHFLPSLDGIVKDVSGQTIVVTGPTSGIGKETARRLALAGANVILACRNVEAGGLLKEEILEQCRKNGGKVPEVEVEPLDLLDRASVRAFARRIGGRPLDALVNNAGMSDQGSGEPVLVEGHERHWACNYLGPYLLTLLLLPALERSCKRTGRSARVVNVASYFYRWARLRKEDVGFASGGYTSGAAYGQSKLAQVLFGGELTRRTGGRVLAVSAFPGFVHTDLPRGGARLRAFAWRYLLRWILLSPTDGCRSSLSGVALEGKLDAPSLLEDLSNTVAAYAINWDGRFIALEDHAVDRDDAAWLWQTSWEEAGFDDEPDAKAIRALLVRGE